MVTNSSILDESATVRSYVWSGERGTFLKLSPSAYHLVKSVEGGATFGEIAEAVGRRQGRTVAAAEVERAYWALADRIALAEMRAARNPPGFLARVPILRPAAVAPIARALRPFFLLWGAACLLPFAITAVALALAGAYSIQLTPIEYLLGYGLYVMSLLVHELGHVGACARFGAKPGEIGAGIFWIFPVFYSDVSAAWQLTRAQRVGVDIGGAYLQLLVAGVFAAAFMYTGSLPYLIALLMIVHSSVFILNPFLRFDGYWMVADTLGVSNLGAQGSRIRRFAWDLVRGRPTARLPWPPRIVAALAAYSLVAVGFWVYFTVRLIPILWGQAAAYPALLAGVFAAAAESRMPSVDQVLGVVVSTYFIAVSALVLRRVGLPLLRVLRRAVRPVGAQPSAP